jgi:hypothetical protein
MLTLPTGGDETGLQARLDEPIVTQVAGSDKAVAVMVWTKLDACTQRDGHDGTIAILQLTGDHMPGVFTPDCGGHVVLRDYESGSVVLHTFTGPGGNRWFMTALVWSAGVLTYYTGYQGEGVIEHTQTGADQPVNDNGTFRVLLGTNQYIASNQGGWTAEWWGLGTWQNADATALLSPPVGNTGNALTWLGILNAFIPFAVTPGTGCIATPSGPQDCTSNPTQQPAPISGSVKKFQIGYLPIVDCGDFPTMTVTFGVSVTIPDPVAFVGWALCEATDVINMGINALIFCANVAIDLVVPDGSGLDGWPALATDASTRFPLGFYTSAYAELAAGLGAPNYGSYACTGDANHFPTSCGFSGGDGSFTFTVGGQQKVIDVPGNMYVLMHPYVPMMSAMVFLFFGIGLIRASRGDLAGKPT